MQNMKYLNQTWPIFSVAGLILNTWMENFEREKMNVKREKNSSVKKSSRRR